MRSAFDCGAAAPIATLGADRCEPLVRVAQQNFPRKAHEKRLHEVAYADALQSGYRSGVFVRGAAERC